MCELIPYEPNLKKLFEECGGSQREAAARLGVSPALVNQALNKGTLSKTDFPFFWKSAACRAPLSNTPSANWKAMSGRKIPPKTRRKARKTP